MSAESDAIDWLIAQTQPLYRPAAGASLTPDVEYTESDRILQGAFTAPTGTTSSAQRMQITSPTPSQLHPATTPSYAGAIVGTVSGCTAGSVAAKFSGVSVDDFTDPDITTIAGSVNASYFGTHHIQVLLHTNTYTLLGTAPIAADGSFTFGTTNIGAADYRLRLVRDSDSEEIGPEWTATTQAWLDSGLYILAFLYSDTYYDMQGPAVGLNPRRTDVLINPSSSTIGRFSLDALGFGGARGTEWRFRLMDAGTNTQIGPEWQGVNGNGNLYDGLIIRHCDVTDRDYGITHQLAPTSGRWFTNSPTNTLPARRSVRLHLSTDVEDPVTGLPAPQAEWTMSSGLPRSSIYAPSDTGYGTPKEGVCFLYDCALALAALVAVEEWPTAKGIARSMADVQFADGPFPFAVQQRYVTTPDRYVPVGVTSWCGYALALYQLRAPTAFQDPLVDAAIPKTLAWLETMRADPTGLVRFGDGRYWPAWQQSTPYVVGDKRVANDQTFVVTVAGTSAASGTGPTGAGPGIVDGSVTWNRISATGFDASYVATFHATEHNVDAERAFRIAAELFDNRGYEDTANAIQRALMTLHWNPAIGAFCQATDVDGEQDGASALDCAAWGGIVLERWGIDARAAACNAHGDASYLVTYSGVDGYRTFSEDDNVPGYSALWLEGSFSMILLKLRIRDPNAAAMLADLESLQETDGGFRYAMTADPSDIHTREAVSGTAWYLFCLHPDVVWSEAVDPANARRFRGIEIWTGLQCQPGSVRLGVLRDPDLVLAKDINAIDEQEGLTFSFTRFDARGDVRPLVAQLRSRLVALVRWTDTAFDEWRIAQIQDSRGADGLVTVTANPLLLDLAEAADGTGKGLISDMAGAVRVFSFNPENLTATELWDTYIIPHCPSWVKRGRIDPTAIIAQLPFNRATPQALAIMVRDALRARDIPCELQLRRNSSTDYKLDLVTQIGAGATVPVFHPRSSLRSLHRSHDPAEQATRLFTQGQNDPSGIPGIPGRARWRVAAIDGTAKTLKLEDPNGGAGPIGFGDQWVDAFILRVKTGRTFAIQASAADDDQTVELLDLSTFAVGEYVELRLTEPLTNTRTIASPSPRYQVSSVGGSAEYLALSSNPITVDGQHVDWYARVWTASSGGSIRKDIRISGSTASTDRVACTPGDASGVLTSDYVEFVQLDGAGEIPSYIERPDAIQDPPAGYGVRVGDLSIESAYGVTQLAKNGWMREWTDPALPPDGWSLLAGSGTKNVDPLFTRYGGASFLADWLGVVLDSPRIDRAQCFGNSGLAVRAFVFFTAFSGDRNFFMRIYALDAAGQRTGASQAQCLVVPVNYSLPVTAEKVAVGTWVKMEIVDYDVPLSAYPYGFTVEFSALVSGAGQCVAYIDALEVYGFMANPEGVYEHGDSTALHQAGNRRLITHGTPPIAYNLTIADLERSDPSTWRRQALTIGGDIRAIDNEINVDTQVRLLRRERDLKRPSETVITLSNLPAWLAQRVLVA